MAAADLVISNAGEGTVAAAMLAGKPQLVLPMHAEQMITGLNVARNGIGLYAALDTTIEQMEASIRRLLVEPGFRDAAQSLARKYADFVPENACARMTTRCEELLALGPRR